MTRVPRIITAILALTVAAVAEDRAPSPPPSIRLTTLSNPVTDEIATATRRARLWKTGTLESLPGVFWVRRPDSPIAYAWDPVECRMAFCQRDTALLFVAEGPGPAAATVGAYGPPQFFGYRMAEGGVPEFLYTQGRLGIEEQIRPGEDGQSLTQRFRIENADYGLLLSVPKRWKDRVKSSAGSWSGDFLKISKSDAAKSFTLTYDLGKPPELPDLPETWKPVVSSADPESTTGEHFLTRIEAAPGFEIQTFQLPGGEGIGGIGRLTNGGLAVATRSGKILIATEKILEPGAVSQMNWSAFSDFPLPDLKIRDAGEMPASILVSHAYGTARLFDTDVDGRADFFKAITSGEKNSSSPADYLTLADWDVFRVSLQRREPDTTACLKMISLGLNPDKPASAQPASAVWIPESLCALPSRPVILKAESGDEGLVLADRSSTSDWRFARVILDRSGEALQGAVIGFQATSLATVDLGELLASGDGSAFWGVPEGGDRLVQISRGDLTSFEVESVHLAPDAFEFTFTKPVDRKAATDLSSARVRSVDPLKPGSESLHRVETAIVDSDALTLSLRVAGVSPGRLVEFDLHWIRSESGDRLSHGPVFYSVNALPDRPMPESGSAVQPASSTKDLEGGVSDSEASSESSPESKDASDDP